MRIVVLVTWRGGDPYREASWEFDRQYLERHSYPMYVSEPDPGTFKLSQAANRATDKADADGRWDLAIIVGADCIIPRESVEAGIGIAIEHKVLTLPHDNYLRL